MTRQEAFHRWNKETADWLRYLKKREELIEADENVETRRGDLEKARRQIQAIYNVKAGVVVNPELLLAFIHPESICKKAEVTVRYTTEQLNETQKKAVRIALGGQCFTLIQGSPGTGKTSVITEVCSQILLKEPMARILVCSETHVAVNNIFNNLNKKFANFMGLRIKDKEIDDDKLREKFQTDYILSEYAERLNGKDMPKGAAALLKEEIESNTRRMNEALFYTSRFVGITCNGIGGISFNARYPFDYVILDENSSKALMWGRKAVMVGDPVQLSPVYTDLDREAMTETRTRHLEAHAYIEDVYGGFQIMRLLCWIGSTA